MSRQYRFILLNASKEAITEVGLVCLNDEDALVVASHVAPRNDVEVWEVERFVGLVPSPYPKTPQPRPAPVQLPPLTAPTPVVRPEPAPALVVPQPAPPPRAPPPVAEVTTAPVPEPLPEPEPEPEPEIWDDPSRPFNPFRRGSWRRRRQS
jgi:outer membrane biosynthesis protein TonB